MPIRPWSMPLWRASIVGIKQSAINIKMKITFESHSLLYGLSHLWLVIQISVPYLIWPNFAKTQSEYVPTSRSRLLSFMDSLGNRIKARRWAPRAAMFVMISLQLGILVATDHVVGFFLNSIGITDTSKLSYKVLLYFPLIIVSYLDNPSHHHLVAPTNSFFLNTAYVSQRSMIVALAYLSTNYSYDQGQLTFWRAFDRADFFSIDPRTQKRYITYSGLICLPTILACGVLEVDWYHDILCTKHPDAKDYVDSIHSCLRFIMLISLSLIDLASVLLRYRHVMTMLYSIICIRQHLVYLNTQVDLYCKANKNDVIKSGVYQHARHNGHHFGDEIRTIGIGPADNRVSKLSNQQLVCINPSSRSITNPQKTLNSSMNGNPGKRIRGSKLILSNLHEFENHLTRLNLFIKQVDIDCSLVVFITVFYHFVVLFHTVFIYRQSTLDVVQPFVFIPYNFAGMLPALSLFTLGSLMEREAKSLMAKLEYLYLQEETHCFMYRQMSGMKYPLWSIFKLLGSIEFNCDQLMHISLSTLKDISILFGASAFVVIQYGKLSSIHKIVIEFYANHIILQISWA